MHKPGRLSLLGSVRVECVPAKRLSENLEIIVTIDLAPALLRLTDRHYGSGLGHLAVRRSCARIMLGPTASKTLLTKVRSQPSSFPNSFGNLNQS